MSTTTPEAPFPPTALALLAQELGESGTAPLVMSGRTRPMVIGLCAEAILELGQRLATIEKAQGITAASVESDDGRRAKS